MALPRRTRITKTYAVTVWGSPSERSLERAKRGIRVEGQWLRVASVRRLGGPRRIHGSKIRSQRRSSKEPEKTRLRVVLAEGRYREIWRLFKALGHPVIELHREKVGFLNDRGLPPGAFRPLTPEEISRLLSGGTASKPVGRRREGKRPGGGATPKKLATRAKRGQP
jgi:23S rRNA pseudouridine2605 synthase